MRSVREGLAFANEERKDDECQWAEESQLWDDVVISGCLSEGQGSLISDTAYHYLFRYSRSLRAKRLLGMEHCQGLLTTDNHLFAAFVN